MTTIPKIPEDTLYITLQHIYTVGGRNKYHWGLFMSGNSSDDRYLLHATDYGREALDLYQEVRKVSNPLRSISMVVVLKVANSPGIDALRACAASIHLMDPAYLPRGEPRWTYAIEEWCQYTADAHLPFKGKAKLFNDLSWTTTGGSKETKSSTATKRATGGRYYGPSPMDIDSTGGYYGSSPMVIDSTGPTSTQRYYGPSPMVTEK
ncbi:hypothetical protein F4805DRAFT_454857 [Annulohypoxylon moriforme]|nr:hypothetical protein F4805DRAFT_454857 [Annulohypoxylon moriforme]